MKRVPLIFGMLLAAAFSLCAQQVDPATPPPPPAQASPAKPAVTPPVAPIDPSTPPPPSAETPAAKTPVAHPIDPSTPPPPPTEDAPAEPAASAEPVFDPLHANRDLDIGEFYFKAGKFDAAIERFREAAQFEPSLAKPWRFLGEAYEKKGANASALEAYRKYLDLLPGAEDAKKVQKRISVLEEKVKEEPPKTASH